MEDFEKELDESCNCCCNCGCGDDCHCTEDSKCCDDCTCDENCECHNNECQCNNDEQCNDCCENNDCNNEHCDCDDNDEHCDCEERNDCCDNADEDEQCSAETTGNDQNDELDDDKCQCGCGENVEGETTADSYFKQLLGLRAEFDNYRKRSQADVAKAYSNGFNQAITKFLPALDSFKMATEYITDQNTLMGIQYIEKGILSTLEKMGIEVIDATGKFDPNFHQAIGSEISPEHQTGDIIKECFKGFKMGEKVIRYSQVIVAK